MKKVQSMILMRKFSLLLYAVCALGICYFGTKASAQGVAYTFQGSVTGVSGDPSLAADSNLYYNQQLDFTILINSAQSGTYVDSNGVTQSIHNLSDPTYPGFYENAFYASFANGTRIWNPAFAGNGAGSANYGSSTTPIYTFPIDPIDANSPLISVTNSPWGALIMAGGEGSSSWFFEVSLTATTMDAANPLNWQVGQTLAVINSASLNGDLSTIDGTVTLTGISPQPSPVPEPSTLALGSLAVVLIAIAFVIRKKSPRFLERNN
jgi:hypothetical protein